MIRGSIQPSLEGQLAGRENDFPKPMWGTSSSSQKYEYVDWLPFFYLLKICKSLHQKEWFCENSICAVLVPVGFLSKHVATANIIRTYTWTSNVQTISNRFPKSNFSTPSPHWLGLVNHFHLTGSPDWSWRPVSLVRAASLNHSAAKYLSFEWIKQNLSGDVDKIL